jgi:hypothetical protein
MKEEVEQELQRGGAPPGYVVTEEGASARVEYLDDTSVHFSTGAPAVRGSYAASPGEQLSRCAEVLERSGYAVELDPGPVHYVLVVRRH